jgi:potassium-transporting ATPase potassium-binding subunit
VSLFVVGLVACDRAEKAPPPQLAGLHIVGGNMEGKEVRFGVGDSVLTAVVTSNTSTGSYNSMYDSYQPVGVLVTLVFMLLGEVVFGGLGTGVYSIVMVALVGAFLSGLMIGRTPVYLGKRIGSGEARWIAVYTLLMPVTVLVLTGVAVATHAGRAGLVTNTGPRGFTEILYAYASCMANNGQTLAGLNANTGFYNLSTIVAMLAGRYGLAALALALAGRFAAQRLSPTTAGTLPNDTPMFGVVVFGTTLLLGALSFLPALALGPLAELFRH